VVELHAVLSDIAGVVDVAWADATTLAVIGRRGHVAFGAFYVDGARHLKAGTTKAQSYKDKGLNMLFCDGHATSVSVREAWDAIHNPGSQQAGD
jgi:prepilin-type processing-associated H-X9-DG protein